MKARVRIRTIDRGGPVLRGRDLRIDAITEDGTVIPLRARSVSLTCDGRNSPVEAVVRLAVDEIDVVADAVMERDGAMTDNETRAEAHEDEIP